MLLKHCIPREHKDLKKTEFERQRTPWNVDLTLFKEYFREEKDDLHMDCFEFDWFNVKQLKYKKSTEEEVKAVMKAGYKMIKEFYKIQAGFGKIGNIFAIALN